MADADVSTNSNPSGVLQPPIVLPTPRTTPPTTASAVLAEGPIPPVTIHRDSSPSSDPADRRHEDSHVPQLDTGITRAVGKVTHTPPHMYSLSIAPSNGPPPVQDAVQIPVADETSTSVEMTQRISTTDADTPHPLVNTDNTGVAQIDPMPPNCGLGAAVMSPSPIEGPHAVSGGEIQVTPASGPGDTDDTRFPGNHALCSEKKDNDCRATALIGEDKIMDNPPCELEPHCSTTATAPPNSDHALSNPADCNTQPIETYQLDQECCPVEAMEVDTIKGVMIAEITGSRSCSDAVELATFQPENDDPLSMPNVSQSIKAETGSDIVENNSDQLTAREVDNNTDTVITSNDPIQSACNAGSDDNPAMLDLVCLESPARPVATDNVDGTTVLNGKPSSGASGLRHALRSSSTLSENLIAHETLSTENVLAQKADVKAEPCLDRNDNSNLASSSPSSLPHSDDKVVARDEEDTVDAVHTLPADEHGSVQKSNGKDKPKPFISCLMDYEASAPSALQANGISLVDQLSEKPLAAASEDEDPVVQLVQQKWQMASCVHFFVTFGGTLPLSSIAPATATALTPLLLERAVADPRAKAIYSVLYRDCLIVLLVALKELFPRNTERWFTVLAKFIIDRSQDFPDCFVNGSVESSLECFDGDGMRFIYHSTWQCRLGVLQSLCDIAAEEAECIRDVIRESERLSSSTRHEVESRHYRLLPLGRCSQKRFYYNVGASRIYSGQKRKGAGSICVECSDVQSMSRMVEALEKSDESKDKLLGRKIRSWYLTPLQESEAKRQKKVDRDLAIEVHREEARRRNADRPRRSRASYV